MKTQIDKLIKRFGLWRLVNTLIIVAIIVLVCVLALEATISVRLSSYSSGAFSEPNLITAGNFSEILQSKMAKSRELVKLIRPNLFKSSDTLRDKPMADKTIERIKSQLKLQCIMEMGGQPVAYINIKDAGLKKCCIGDSISDLFKVLDIGKDSVQITIVDHKVTLHL